MEGEKPMSVVSRARPATAQRLAREYLRLSQTELAEATGMRQPTAEGYETGRFRLSPEKERRLLRFLVDQLATLHCEVKRPERLASVESLRDDLLRALGVAYAETAARLGAEADSPAADNEGGHRGWPLSQV